MVYKENFAVAVRVNGKVLREQDGTVFLPFGSEYSIRLKNLNSRKAMVRISVDGQDVLDGGQIVSHPNQPFDLERWIINGRLDKGPRFKFIEKTEQISDHRGNREDDGIIRVEYFFEKEAPDKKTIIHEHHHWHRSPWYYYTSPNYTYGSTYNDGSEQTVFTSNVSENNICCDALDSSLKGTPNLRGLGEKTVQNHTYMNQVKDQGITVKGSESQQSLMRVTDFPVEEKSHVLCLQLKGKSGKAFINKPIGVKTRIQCEVCGKSNKSNQKFCGDCGNNLIW